MQIIKDCTIKSHIKKTANHYKAKRDFMATMLNKHIENKTTYIIYEGGLVFWIVTNKQMDWSQISKKLKSKGTKIITSNTYTFNQTTNSIRFGYGSISEKELEEGVLAFGSYPKTV